jgi:hypothetical protein
MHIVYWWESRRKETTGKTKDINGWTILKWILERYDWVVSTELIWLRIGTSGSSCEHGDEPSGSIKCWEILERLHN